MSEPVDERRDLEPESISDVDRRVWDMTLNLIHPAFFYVVFQLVILDHFWRSPALAGRSPIDPAALGLYGLQFLGAWTVFYTTLLRDMGYRSAWGTILLLVALVSVIAQYIVFPSPDETTASAAWSFLGVQMGLAAIGWPLTWVQWRRNKRQWEHQRAQHEVRR